MHNFDEVTFINNINCPFCEKKFDYREVKSKYLIVERQDSDFCSYYKDINPIYYDVLVCSNCGYAFTKESANAVGQEERGAINDILAKLRINGGSFAGVRTIEQAIRAYNLAIICQELRKAKDSIKGSLYLRLGWLYRYQGNNINEEKSLQKALEHMKRAYEKESTTDIKKELRIMYLIGELSYRTGSVKEAVQWLQSVTFHKEAKNYPVFERMARNRWQDIRQDMKEKNNG